MANSFLPGQIPFVVNIQQKQKPRIDTIKENGEYNIEAYRGVNIQVPGATTKDLFEAIANGTYDIAEYAKVKVDVPNPSTGTKDITANGNNIDVKDYAAVNVNVPNPSSGTLQITENGDNINVTNYAYVDVNVSGSGGKVILPIDTGNTSYISFEPASNAGILKAYDGVGSTYYIQEEGSEDIKIEGSFLDIQGPVEDESSCTNMSSDILDDPINISDASNLVIVLAGVCSDDMDIDYDSRLSIGFTDAAWISDRSQAVSWLRNKFGLDSYSNNYIKIVDINGRLLKQTTFDDESLFSITWSGGC